MTSFNMKNKVGKEDIKVNCRMIWVERGHKDLVPTHLICTGTPFTRSGCSNSHPI